MGNCNLSNNNENLDKKEAFANLEKNKNLNKNNNKINYIKISNDHFNILCNNNKKNSNINIKKENKQNSNKLEVESIIKKEGIQNSEKYQNKKSIKNSFPSSEIINLQERENIEVINKEEELRKIKMELKEKEEEINKKNELIEKKEIELNNLNLEFENIKKNIVKREQIQLEFEQNKDKIIEEEIKKRNKPILIGLNNIGATCYMNATLQSLSNTKDLTDYFLKTYKSDPKKIMANEYHKLIVNLWKRENNNIPFSPNSFKEVLSKENPLFAGIAANDSKDLINFLIERFHTELNIVNNNISDSNINDKTNET